MLTEEKDRRRRRVVAAQLDRGREGTRWNEKRELAFWFPIRVASRPFFFFFFCCWFPCKISAFSPSNLAKSLRSSKEERRVSIRKGAPLSMQRIRLIMCYSLSSYTAAATKRSSIINLAAKLMWKWETKTTTENTKSYRNQKAWLPTTISKSIGNQFTEFIVDFIIFFWQNFLICGINTDGSIEKKVLLLVIQIRFCCHSVIIIKTRLESYNDPRPSTNQSTSLKNGLTHWSVCFVRTYAYVCTDGHHHQK